MVKKLLLSFLESVCTFFLLTLFFFFNLLPCKVVWFIARFLGRIFYYVNPHLRSIVLTNLKLCFPYLSQQERIKLAKDNFKESMIVLFDYRLMFFASRKKIESLVTIKDMDRFEELREKFFGKIPVIFLTPHFLAIDLCALRVRLGLNVDSITIYKPFSRAFAERQVLKVRTRFQDQIKHKTILFSRNVPLHKVVATMRAKKIPMYYLPDQDVTGAARVFVPFFHYPYCPTITACSRLAKVVRGVVVPVAVYRTSSGYEIRIGKVLQNFPSSSLESDARRMNSCIEASILMHPSQYLWTYRRFRTHPFLEKNFVYSRENLKNSLRNP